MSEVISRGIALIASDARHTADVVAAPSPGSDLRANRCRPLPACGRRQAAAAGEAIGRAEGLRTQRAESRARRQNHLWPRDSVAMASFICLTVLRGPT